MRNEKISSLSISQNFFSAIYNRIKNLIPYIENTVYSQWNVKSKYFFKIIVILHFNPDVIFVSRRIARNDERPVHKTRRTKDYKGTITLVHSSYSKIPQSFTVTPSNFIPGNTQRQRRSEYVTFPSNCVSIQIGYRTKLLSGKS